jgi:hypothetical protein
VTRTNGTIVVAGAIAQKPRHGGHTWVFLQYLLGLQRLGWDVLFVDRLDPRASVDGSGRPCPPDRSFNVRYVTDVMTRFGLGRSFAIFAGGSETVAGCERDEVLARVDRSAFLLNIMGFLRDEDILSRASMRVFLDIDPGYGQMWRELGLADVLGGHDVHVTIAENIGRPGCAVPTCGLDWITTRQPVVLDQWPAQGRRGRGFTTVASWRGAYGPVQYGGARFGQRVHEFRRFVRLPKLTGEPFLAALDIHPGDTGDLKLLADNGWTLVDPKAVAGNPWIYRSFVQSSSAELMVAKGMYVQTRSGWFSDRSICYLASGKPVVAQDTGLGDLYPAGKGLLTFTDLETAKDAVREVGEDYPAQSRSARLLAEDYFDSDKVLARLLDRLGVD